MIFLRFLYILSCLFIFSFYFLYHSQSPDQLRPPSPLFFKLEQDIKVLQEEIREINHKAEYGYFFKHDQEMLQRHARNGTVWIMSTNKGMLPLAFNLLCSLAHFDPSLIDHIVFHAVDVEAKIALEKHRWHDQWKFTSKNNAIPTYGKRWGYGVLYNPLFSGSSERTSWDAPEYEKMMRQRPSFFLTLLRSMGLNILFSDVDIVYYHDPLKFVTDNFLTGDADMALSTDARNMFDSLGNDYDRYLSANIKIPSFCGGFFFAKSNHRTISFFEKLEKFLEVAYDTNDQTGFERVLEEQTDLRLVGRLPRGLATKPGINSDKLVKDRGVIPPLNRTEGNEDTLSVHILDQWQFINGIVYERHQTKWEADRMRGKLIGDEVQVMKHANFPPGEDKLVKMKKYGWWFLSENDETCLPVSWP